MYRRHLYLWKIKDVSFANKHTKEEADIKLLEFYKTAIPTAIFAMVKKISTIYIVFFVKSWIK